MLENNLNMCLCSANLYIVLKYIYVQVNEIHIQLRNLSSIDSLNDQFALV